MAEFLLCLLKLLHRDPQYSLDFSFRFSVRASPSLNNQRNNGCHYILPTSLFFNWAKPSVKDQQRHPCFPLVDLLSFYRDLPTETILFHLPYRKADCTTCSSLFLLRHCETKQHNIRISPFLQGLGFSEVFFFRVRLFSFLLLLRSKHQDQLYPSVFRTRFFFPS